MSSPTATAAPPRLRPEEPVGPKIFRWGITLAILIPLIWSAAGLNVTWDRVLSAPADIWNIVHRMVPPDLTPETVQRAMPKVMESLFIAWVGTIIAASLSLPLAILAARNLTTDSSSFIIRQIFILIRSVPELLLAMVLIPVTGLGPWTGVLAIGLHSIGTLGRLSSEVMEGIDPGPVEAIASSGAGRLSQIRYGVLPQVMPTITAYWLYRFEINIRASAVLGAVGVGGIGLELIQQLAFRNYARVGTVLFLTIAVVLAIDTVSARLRRRIITGNREPGPVAIFLKAGLTQRVTMITMTVLIAVTVAFLLIQLQAPA
ncbi:MAG TPA: phosphonate ABC transporter, permease protein PhnE [Acidimicrobiia bacterium]|nr:phosphonate ABC transporter, permease protein PhnE [Acidimicrobiia bacterium]